MGIADLTPAGFENLIFKNALKRQNKEIPFAAPPYDVNVADGQQTKFLVFFKTNELNSETEARNSVLFKNKAVDRFIEHYFPEYYLFLYSELPVTQEQMNAVEPYRQDYDALRALIFDSLYVDDTHIVAGPVKNKIVYGTDVNLYQERLVLEITAGHTGNEPNLPDYSIVLSVLNEELGRTAAVASTSVKFQNAPTQMDKLTGEQSGFGVLMNQLAQRAGTPNMNSMQSAVNGIVKKITDSIHDSIDYRSQRRGPGFYDTDYFTVTFDSGTQIVEITYFVAGAGTGPAALSKVGYITNIKYNPLFKDPFALNLLRSHEQILELNEQNVLTGTEPDILDFLDRLGTAEAGGFGDALGGDPVYGIHQDGPFAPRNVDDYVAVDPEGAALLRALDENPMTPEREAELEELKNDPVFGAKMKQAQQAQRINTAVQVLDVVGQVAEMDPSNLFNNTPAGREANRIMQMFGIQDLAKEVLTCLTLGLGASVQQITETVKDSILNTTVDFNSPPTPPSAQFDIKRPNISDFKPDVYFSVTGDPPIGKRIVAVLLDAIVQAAFEIIKGLAEALKFNCGDVLDALRGEVDCGAELRRRNTQAQVELPNLKAELDAIAGTYEMTQEEAYEYFSAVSTILTPIEACRLLNSQEAVTNTTLENIFDFNEDYSPPVAASLNTQTGILAFFRSMSAYVDTTSFCNEIIETSIAAAIQGCNICLDDDLFVEPLAPLIEIAENGYQIPMPAPPDLLCPDSENYLENPLAAITIPNLFNQIMSATEIFMAGSLEGARTRLLEPSISTEVNTIFSGACESAGVSLEPVEVDPAAMDFLTNLFNFMENITDQVLDGDNCPDLTGSEFESLMENIEVIVGVVNDVLAETPEIIEDVAEKINQVRDSLGDAGATNGPPHIEYVFPQQYGDTFKNAIEKPVMSSFGPGSGYFGQKQLYSAAVDYFGLSQYTQAYMKLINLGTSGEGIVNIYYNAYYSEESFKGVQVGYTVGDISSGPVTTQPNYADPEYSARVATEAAWIDTNINPYIWRFAGPVALDRGYLPATEEMYDLIGSEYPILYGSIIRGVYDYIVSEGAFSADVLNNLQLFKDNRNCTPANTGDLFDADGIIDQMRKEFAAGACYDGGTAKDKIQNALYYGLLNMLIQTVIDEIIVSNIIVFSALNMDDILNPRYPFKEIIVTAAVESFNRIIADGDPIVEREMFNYFQRASKRPPAQLAGGLAHSYTPDEVAPGFEYPSFPGNNNDLVRFLVEERLGYNWMDGDTQRSTIQAIQNVIDPTNSNKLFEDFFLEDVLGLYTISDDDPATAEDEAISEDVTVVAELVEASWANEQASTSARRAFNSQLYFRDSENLDGEDIKLIYRTGHFDSGVPGTATVLFSIPSPPSTSTRAEKLDYIKSSEEYQLFFNQAINRYACLLMPVLHSMKLTNQYFDDVVGAFDSTKRAIISMFNFVDESQTQPALEPRQSEYVQSLSQDPAGSDFGSMAREIFLKFLRETPINILKGLVELIDPHVAISKIIRDLTGSAFTEVTKGINAALTDEQRDQGLTGENILGLVFCLYNIANQIPDAMHGPADEPPDGADNLLFGPKLTLDGVDFKGTVAGMLMLPPSPLGIIYLLIELLKMKITDDLGAEEDAIENEATEAEAESCPEGTTPLDIEEIE